MKKILITLIIILSPTLVGFAQDTVYMPVHIVKEAGYYEGGTYYDNSYIGNYTYNDNGLVTRYSGSYYNDCFGSYLSYHYDGQGRETGRYRSSLYDAGMSNSTRDSLCYEYHNDLLVCKKRAVIVYPNYLVWRSRETYEYDIFKRCVLKKTYSLDDINSNAPGVLSAETTYEYSVDGLEQIETYAKVDGGIQYRYIRHYNVDGNLIEVVYQKASQEELVNNTKTLNVYQNGCLTETVNIIWKDEAWLVSDHVLYDVDEEHRVHAVLYQDTDALGEYVNTVKAEYTYDDRGLCVFIQEYSWTDGDWVANPMAVKNEKVFWEERLAKQDELARFDNGHFNVGNTTIEWERKVVYPIHPNYPSMDLEGEWYYEILNDDGSITYQYLQCAGDTTISNERTKIVVRTNQIYDKDDQTEVTREYLFERAGVVYWWNKELQEFTVLYDLAAEVGDEWEVKVGAESIVMHVDAVGSYEYDGKTYRMLSVSDPNHLFSGDIVCGIGHLTSFFPERLMNQDKGYRVEGIRCFWQDENLVFQYGDKDCDEVYEQHHHGVDENGLANSIRIYPNPTDGLLHIETLRTTSLPLEYHITNIMGQTLIIGRVETSYYGVSTINDVNVSKLPPGLYFITLGTQTLKFTKQ